MVDLVIRNARVVTPQGVVWGGVAVAGEKVVAVAEAASLPRGREEVDAGGLVLLPGLIDPHTHMGLGARPGRGRAKFEEDFAGVSAEAAVGGITTLITTALFGRVRDSLLPCLREAKEIGSRNSLVDFRITAFMLYPAHIPEVPAILEEGITSFKFLLAYRGEEGRQVGIPGINWAFVYQAFEVIGKYSPPALAMVHAEEPEIIEFLRERLQKQGRRDLAAWSESRPGICEAMHVLSAGLIARELGVPLYVVHTSAGESLEAARFLRQRGCRVAIETCPHYLVFTKHSAPGPWAKVNPPLREEADCRALWQGLRDGTVDAIGSDHACYQWEHKQGDIWEMMPGFPSLGATLAVLVSEGVNRGRISWQDLARLAAENPARLFHLYPRKGVIAPGADADLVLVDPEREWVLEARSMRSASAFTLYDGVKVRGKAVRTYLRGKLVAEDGQPVARPPLGQFIAPAG